MSLNLYDFPALEPVGGLVAADSSPASRAAEILARAEMRAAEIASEAAARGHQEGVAAAHELLAPARDALLAGAEELAALRAELRAQAELRAVELGLAVARKVLGTALAADPALVKEVVLGALRSTTARDHLVVEVNPDDVELVRSSITDAAAQLGVGRLEVVAERRVARGGCVVRMEDGEIDATIGEQLARAEEILLEAFTARRADD
jgi:flagellar biosynthesis/type III secretory pathway protein FliH